MEKLQRSLGYGYGQRCHKTTRASVTLMVALVHGAGLLGWRVVPQ
jgi:hypothetical protein